jgi:hypothetical protein
MNDLTPHQLSYLAVAHVRVQLAKRGVIAIDAPAFFEYDLITQGGLRIEVKSSRMRNLEHPYWAFTNTREGAYTKGAARHQRTDRKCDYFILVGFRDYEFPTFFVLPKEIIGMRRTIHLPYNRRYDGRYTSYRDLWEPLTNVERRLHPS